MPDCLMCGRNELPACGLRARKPFIIDQGEGLYEDRHLPLERILACKHLPANGDIAVAGRQAFPKLALEIKEAKRAASDAATS